MPTECYKQYVLQVEKPSILSKGKTYWSPVGLANHTVEEARHWLNADFRIWEENPDAKYRIVEKIIWNPSESVVEESTRQKAISS